MCCRSLRTVASQAHPSPRNMRRLLSESSIAGRAGDLLRAEVESGGPQAAELQRIMKEGQLVPDETMITLLKARQHRGSGPGSGPTVRRRARAGSTSWHGARDSRAVHESRRG